MSGEPQEAFEQEVLFRALLMHGRTRTWLKQNVSTYIARRGFLLLLHGSPKILCLDHKPNQIQEGHNNGSPVERPPGERQQIARENVSCCSSVTGPE